MKSYPDRAARARARASRRVLEGGTKLDSAFLQRVAERERVHRDVVHALATSLDERRVLDLALRQACRVLEAPYGRVWLRELDDSLVVAAVQGPIRRGQIGDRISPVSIPGLVAESEVLVSLPDATAHPRWQDPDLAQATDLRAYLGAPLRRAGERLGALEVMRPGDRVFTSEDGQVLCGLASAAAVAVSNARVLSRERAARSAADRQSGLLSAVLEHIEDAVIVAEPDGRIVLANRAAATLWGVPGDQLVGMLVNSGTRSVCDLQGSPLLPQDRPFERALRGFEGPSEIVLVTPQGRERQVRVFPRALRSPSGEIDALVFVVRDLTEVRAAEWQKEILARTEKLRAMGQMAGGVAHDLNQSLGLIAGYADLALRGLEGESVEPQRLKEMLGTVSRAALDGAATVTVCSRSRDYSRKRPRNGST